MQQMAEDRVRLEVGKYFSTVRKVSLKDQLAHLWQLLKARGVLKKRLAVGRGGDPPTAVGGGLPYAGNGAPLLLSPDFRPPSPVASF